MFHFISFFCCVPSFFFSLCVLFGCCRCCCYFQLEFHICRKSDLFCLISYIFCFAFLSFSLSLYICFVLYNFSALVPYHMIFHSIQYFRSYSHCCNEKKEEKIRRKLYVHVSCKRRKIKIGWQFSTLSFLPNFFEHIHNSEEFQNKQLKM